MLSPVPMRDGARVIQAIRLNAAKWNIDPERISVSGISAGAVIAMWIGYHDDLAQPDSDDPIARQSSRVKCVIPINGPTNMDPNWIRANLGGPHEIHPTLPKMYGVTAGIDKPEVRARIQASNPWALVSADDPPTLMIYARDTEPMPLAANVGTSYLIHHPQFGVALKYTYDLSSETAWSDVGIGATSSGPDPNGVEIAVEENNYDTEFIQITLPIGSDRRIFGRIRVSVTP